MKKNFIQFHEEFKEYFNSTAPARIEDIFKLDNRAKIHNKFCNLRIEYIIEFTKRYIKTEWTSEVDYISPNQVGKYAELFVNELLKEYLDNRKKTFED